MSPILAALSDSRPLPEMVVATVAAGRPACTAPGIDPDLFFPDADDTYGIAWAKRVCAACPFRAECLQGAMDRAEAWGVWGGLSEEERPRPLLELPRACPRCAAPPPSGRTYCSEPCAKAARAESQHAYEARRRMGQPIRIQRARIHTARTS